MSRITRISRLHYLVLTVAVAAAALLVLGCDHETGIFASLERETEITNRNLRDSTSVAGVARAGDTYFAALGSVYAVSGPLEGDPTTTWQPLESPGGAEAGWIALSVAGMGDTLYTAFKDAAGAYQGVYTYTPGADAPWSSDPIDDGKIAQLFAFDTDADGAGDTLLGIEEVTGEGVAPQTYQVVFDLTGGSPTVAGPDADSPLRLNAVLDAAYSEGDPQATDDEYWILTQDTLYIGADPTSLTAQDLTGDLEGLAEAPPFAAVHADGEDLFVTNRAGVLYRRLAGDSSWTSHEVSGGAPLGDPVLLPAIGSAERQLYIPALTNDDNEVGGYFVMTRSGETASRPDDPSYVSAELSNAAVTGFQLFSEGNGAYELFARTADTGLWSRSIVTSPDSDELGLSTWRWE